MFQEMSKISRATARLEHRPRLARMPLLPRTDGRPAFEVAGKRTELHIALPSGQLRQPHGLHAGTVAPVPPRRHNESASWSASCKRYCRAGVGNDGCTAQSRHSCGCPPNAIRQPDLAPSRASALGACAAQCPALARLGEASTAGRKLPRWRSSLGPWPMLMLALRNLVAGYPRCDQ